MQIEPFFEKAKRSSWGLSKLNFILQRAIPFNKPHHLRVVKISDESVEVRIPYRKKNLNHLGGLHACVLATGAEYCSGILLLNCLGSKKYRLIMESLDVKYHYQAKSDCVASFSLNKSELDDNILKPLKKSDAVFFQCQIEVHDAEGNHICTVRTNWQIKSWKNVKTSR